MADPFQSIAKRHKRHERQVAREVTGFLLQQARRLAANVREAGLLTAEMIPHVMSLEQEHKAFMRMIRRPLAKVFLQEAAAEYGRIPKRKPKKADDTDRAIRQAFRQMPADAVDTLRLQLDELEAQDYWQAIQATTKERLTRNVLTGIGNGLSNVQIGKSIVQALGGTVAKSRGLAIARTETTGAMNAAHHGVQVALAQSGLVTSKVWNSTMDKNTRSTHSALHGVAVKPGENFNVGGHPAPYPGHWGLPAEERVNCRCVTISKSPLDSSETLSEEDEEEIAQAMMEFGLV